MDVMSDAGAQLLEHLHHVTKHLSFWQELSEVQSFIPPSSPTWAILAMGVCRGLRHA